MVQTKHKSEFLFSATIKKRLWWLLFGCLGTVLAVGVFLGGVLGDVRAAKKHVDEHPQRQAEYQAVIQEFRTATAIINMEIKAATEHRARQDRYLKQIVGHLARLGVIAEPIVMKSKPKGSGGIPN